MEVVVDHAFAADVSAPARARAMLDELLLPAAVKADVALLVSELITNAIRHAAAPEGSRVRLNISVSPARMRVEVQDAGLLGKPLRALPPDPNRPGGLGLALVSRISSRWGLQRTPTTTVWFELDYEADVGSVLARDPEGRLSAACAPLAGPPDRVPAVAAGD